MPQFGDAVHYDTRSHASAWERPIGRSASLLRRGAWERVRITERNFGLRQLGAVNGQFVIEVTVAPRDVRVLELLLR